MFKSFIVTVKVLYIGDEGLEKVGGDGKVRGDEKRWGGCDVGGYYVYSLD